MERNQDQELVNLIQGSSEASEAKEEALILLYRKYLKLVYGYFYRQTNSTTEAEDLTSETFLAMVAQINSFKGVSSFKNWLFGIAKFKLLAYLRHKYQHSTQELSEDLSGAEYQEEDESVNQSLISQIADLLLRLPSRYAQVLELRFLQNLSLQETADTLKISLSNAKVLQFRALKKANQIARQQTV